MYRKTQKTHCSEKLTDEAVHSQFMTPLHKILTSSPTASNFVLWCRRSREDLCRELKQRGRERERERDKTIDLVTEYNHFTWECNHLATFPPSSLETERENLNFGARVRIISIFMQF